LIFKKLKIKDFQEPKPAVFKHQNYW